LKIEILIENKHLVKLSYIYSNSITMSVESKSDIITDQPKIMPINGVPDAVLRPGKHIFDGLEATKFSSYTVFDDSTSQARQRLSRNITNDVAVQLDENYATVDHVPGLKTTLYPHQKTSVHGMLEYENKRKFDLPNSSWDPTSIVTINYNASVLSDPVGSGKTVNILALILLKALPRALPDIIALKTQHSNRSVGFVKCRFKTLLTPTIIFVGASVMKQWENAIRTFTDLRSFSVNTVKELRLLFNMMSIGTLNRNYDIVLVKNGKITVPIELPNNIELHEKNKVGQPYIYNLLDNCNVYCWARVVVDDFDTIGLPHNAGTVRGVFTWYVSSTRKPVSAKQTRLKETQLASQCLQRYSFGCNNTSNNHFMFNALNVRNRTDFIKSATQLPRPKYHVCLFTNPHNKYMSLMNSMGSDEVNRITEMLNGDAIGEAAAAAGVVTTSVADIFSTILGNKFNDYRTAGDIIEFIDYEQSDERKEARLPMDECDDPDARYGKKNLLEFEEIEYKYPGVNTLLKENYDNYTEIKKSSGLAIERVKSNIQHGSCPICRMDLSDSKDTVIVKCCNAVFCGSCGFKGQGLGDRYNRLSNGHCANCRATLSIKDLIYIGADSFGLEDIVDENFEYAEDDESDFKDPSAVKLDRTKYDALIDIINGIAVHEDKRVDLHIPNMMKGDKSLPEAKIRKVLIFANFEETLKKVTDKLTKEKIKFWRLQGGIGEIDSISNTFTDCEETCALVINSTKHCSGLNLQTATDLVFAHRMMEQAVESQVAGRGHRLGRMSPLNIWYMLYDNEYSTLKTSHNIRELSKKELQHEDNLELGKEVSTLDVKDNTKYTAVVNAKTKTTKRSHRRSRAIRNNNDSDSDDSSSSDGY
jgi:SNF2 family DNA or RNA helicase